MDHIRDLKRKLIHHEDKCGDLLSSLEGCDVDDPVCQKIERMYKRCMDDKEKRSIYTK